MISRHQPKFCSSRTVQVSYKIESILVGFLVCLPCYVKEAVDASLSPLANDTLFRCRVGHLNRIHSLSPQFDGPSRVGGVLAQRVHDELCNSVIVLRLT